MISVGGVILCTGILKQKQSAIRNMDSNSCYVVRILITNSAKCRFRRTYPQGKTLNLASGDLRSEVQSIFAI